jgi:hypothetical protein
MSLFIKTSLLGDGIHHMPALSPSAVCQHPGCGAWGAPSPNTLMFLSRLN